MNDVGDVPMPEWVIESARSIPLRTLYPVLLQVADDPIDRDMSLRTRTRNVLLRWHGIQWRPYLDRTVEDFVKRRNCGPTTIVEVLSRAERLQRVGPGSLTLTDGPGVATTEDVDSADEPIEATSAPALSADLRQVAAAAATIALWGSGERGIDRLTDAVEAASQQEPPPMVTSALKYLNEFAWDRAFPTLAWSFDVVGQLQQVWLDLDPREQKVFQHRMAALRTGATLEQLGREFGITRERVRQLESRIVRTLDRARMRYPVVARTADALATEFGVAAPVEEAVSGPAWRALGIETLRSPEAALLLWMAGPYEAGESWLIRAPSQSVVTRSAAVIRTLTASGPVSAADVVEALAAIGVRERFATDWLVSIGGARVRDDYVVA